MPPVLLKNALAKSDPLQAGVRTRLRALTSSDRQLILSSQHKRVGDSLDLDKAGRADHPNKNRWDYLLSVPDASQIVGLEPHSARDSEVSVVIAKKNWAMGYLVSRLPMHKVARWFWVTHGNVGFSRMDKSVRRLDQHGIKFSGRLLRSLD